METTKFDNARQLWEIAALMQVAIYKNPAALRFIRCLTPIPSSPYQAGGTGWTLQQALARCESEVIERAFALSELRDADIRPLGIAAHVNFEQAREHALQESIETICVQEIHSARTIHCLALLKFGRFALGIARTTRGYFCMIRGTLGATPIAAHSAGRSLISTLLKAWEEYQSLKFFRPDGELLKKFTRANSLFSEDELRELQFTFEPQFTYRPHTSRLELGSAERSGRVIVYYFDSKGAVT